MTSILPTLVKFLFKHGNRLPAEHFNQIWIVRYQPIHRLRLVGPGCSSGNVYQLFYDMTHFFPRLSRDVPGQKIQGPLPGEFRRLRVMALTGFIAESMLGRIAIKLVIYLPVLKS